ncbi:3-deoxy-7-phosphoheptulonate synthase [Actinoplanes sp. NPDC051411]|uniref:3-deoxy-7-phosphoheptulonate synthase n=1 Tax=Actinoplanes sp. NPDC051411 TaxID=3155522 RepID=UPI00341F9387
MTRPHDPAAHAVALVRDLPARQQPRWAEPGVLADARRSLAQRPALVGPDTVDALRHALARVAAGAAQVVQAGDCAEDLAECGPADILRKAGLLDLLAGTLQLTTQRPVLRVGRIAGQYAKPRSHDTEIAGGQVLPVYRGHLVNGPEPDPVSRRPDPRRLLLGHRAADAAISHLGWRLPAGATALGAPVWTSHEALILDYELPQLRAAADGRIHLTSTHWPWVGDRTRQPHGAHVALLAAVANPVAAKVGPGMTEDELVALCRRLDPRREPGRLSLIARLSARETAGRLPGLVRAVRRHGHPVIWLVDPMHGNTVRTATGLKTRYVETLVQVVRAFQDVVRAGGGVAGGLHLETTPDDVTECVADASHADEVGNKYTTLCDPRLNPGQARAVVSSWTG